MADGSSQASAFPFLNAATPAEHGRLRTLVTVVLAGAAGLLASIAAAVAVIIVAVVIAAAHGTDPTRATAELGKELFEGSVVAFCEALREISTFNFGRPQPGNFGRPQPGNFGK